MRQSRAAPMGCDCSAAVLNSSIVDDPGVDVELPKLAEPCLTANADASAIADVEPDSFRRPQPVKILTYVVSRGDFAASRKLVGSRSAFPWNIPVSKAECGNSFCCRDLVLAVSSQDGGAHIDLTIDEAYKRLSRENSLLVFFSTCLETAHAWPILCWQASGRSRPSWRKHCGRRFEAPRLSVESLNRCQVAKGASWRHR